METEPLSVLAPAHSSPSSTGPAGPQFEAQVGAYYLLSLLSGAEPRGLPGTRITRVEMQRAAQGRPLDDVIIHAQHIDGRPAVLEIQVKREITFAPKDPTFEQVTHQIARAFVRSDFLTTEYQLAIATAKISPKIAGPYQDLLSWARSLGSATVFLDQVQRAGSGNADMRMFVETFRLHLTSAGASSDNETVWQILRRLQILVFDFTAPGSANEALVLERARHALHPDEGHKARNLWSTLTERALDLAADAGDLDRDRLIHALTPFHYRLAGERRFTTAREKLAENSSLALADIDDRLGEITLNRVSLWKQIHTARDTAHYIEIRGAGGAGKSGVLKHCAQQAALESQVIVCAPGRIVPGGLAAWGAQLGLPGPGREFVTDLAAGGTADIFIDSLESFSPAERVTVVDLVRVAAEIPGISIIATARDEFGIDEPTWLPKAALTQLGPPVVVAVGDLTNDEVEELRQATPRLAALLSDSHPARDVTRNLYRLNRLLRGVDSDTVPYTEAQMALRWWSSADGNRGPGHRERARALRAVANQALVGTGAINVSTQPETAIEALIDSETLRDLGADRVSFRHDVLLEWAVANLLREDLELLTRFDLTRVASLSIARGLELAARLALEESQDGSPWTRMLERVSATGTHNSWRRAVLLAIVRSERGQELLSRLENELLADEGRLVREVVRIIYTVDVEDALARLAPTGLDLHLIPEGLLIPRGPGWSRLILWLLSLGGRLAPAVIPDVAYLYFAWTKGMMFGRDPLTPHLLPWLYCWWEEIDRNRYAPDETVWQEPFEGKLAQSEIAPLRERLRVAFLSHCEQVPKLAVRYIQRVRKRPLSDKELLDIVRFGGGLPQAAPVEIAQLTLDLLLPKTDSDEDDSDSIPRGPFTYHDDVFSPPGWRQGPFLALLTFAPNDGFPLVRALTDHAVSFYSGGRAPSGGITLELSTGPRAFPWARSYGWVRSGAHHNALTSALMAIEEWGHRQIEANKPVEAVISTVLGAEGAPAAYLLVAVDLVLSHWPRTHEAAIPFLGNPELLCLDSRRHDEEPFLGAPRPVAGPLAYGTEAPRRDPRRHTLINLFGSYAHDTSGRREQLLELLRQAAARLGPYGPTSTFTDPRLMVAYAINLLDSDNYEAAQMTLGDGSTAPALRYRSPPDEARHLLALQAGAPDLGNVQLEANLSAAFDGPQRSSPELAVAAYAWALRQASSPALPEGQQTWFQRHSELVAAFVLLRDGDRTFRETHRSWTWDVIRVNAATVGKVDAYQLATGLRFNEIAVLFVATAYFLKDHLDLEALRLLLELAATKGGTAAAGFAESIGTLAEIDPRLPYAVIRHAFTASIQPRRIRGGDAGPVEDANAREASLRRLATSLGQELAWLTAGGSEPGWPVFPPVPSRVRHRIRILPPGGDLDPLVVSAPPPDPYLVDSQGAARWLAAVLSPDPPAIRPWALGLLQAYSAWTTDSNGTGLHEDLEIANPPREWTAAYWELSAYCVSGLTAEEIDHVAVRPLLALNDEPFLDALTAFLPGLDVRFFAQKDRGLADVADIRRRLAERLQKTIQWRRLDRNSSPAVERHLGPAIASVFFNRYSGFHHPICYLGRPSAERLEPLLPTLVDLVESGRSLFVATVALNLFNSAPLVLFLPPLFRAVDAWLSCFPDDRAFWIDNEVGSRLTEILKNIILRNGGRQALHIETSTRIERVIGELIRIGVAEAGLLERILARQ